MAWISRSAGLFNGLLSNRQFSWGILSTFGVLLSFFFLLSGIKYFNPAPEVSTIAEFFAEFPMRFQSNDGVFTEDVKFFSKGYQYDLLFMDNEVLLNLYSNEHSGEVAAIEPKTKLSQISLEFIGAKAATKIKGLGTLQFTTAENSLNKGDAPSSYTEVKYANVFPGVDVYFHGKQKQLFYEFVLNEHADANLVKLKLYGIDSGIGDAGDIEIDLHGNVTVKCRGKKMLIKKPMVYRLVNQKKQAVNGYFFVTRENEIHFKAVDSARAT
ncbi:DUF7948 domain-containing protein [Kaarinaea lacus]